jgi:hypothetical protein
MIPPADERRSFATRCCRTPRVEIDASDVRERTRRS